MYKLCTFIFLTSTIVMATIYFSGSNEQLVTSDLSASSKELQVENDKLKRELLKLKNDYDKLQTRKKLESNSSRKASELTNDILPEGMSLVEMTDLEQEVRDLMRERIVQSIESRHARLFNKLNLSATEREDLLETYRARMMSRMKFGMQMRGLDTDEEREVLRVEQEKEREAGELALQVQLGDQYDIYMDYQDKRDDYQTIDSMNRKLKDNSLDEVQSEKLATIMNDLSKTYSSLESLDYRQMNDEEKEAYKTDMTARNEELLVAAADDLSVDQLKVLKQQLESNLKNSVRRGGRSFGRGSR